MILIGRGLDPRNLERGQQKNWLMKRRDVRELDVQFSGCETEAERGREEVLREAEGRTRKNSGGNGEGEPPVPIPNTEVKHFSGDNSVQA